MENNEEATIQTLNTYRNSMSSLIQQYRGRVVDTTGDNLLAEFTSAVDAVNCAVEIQRDLGERNAELTYERKMEFRIGVNVGDVVEEEDRIYGEGVNIAARVESMADTGGICISGRTFDQVANKLDLEYENLGEHQVKNISTPIRVYRVLSYPGAAAHRVVQAKVSLGKRWRTIAISAAVVVVIAVGLGIWQFYMRRPAIEPASIDKMAFPLPEKPSIAVLPFDNMTGDPKQEFLSDGITENIIATLSKTELIFVIARNSTFVYKGKPVKVKQVAEELGVRYVLEGSVQKAEGRVRITAQLIDAITGHHLWSERYDRDLKDIFALQDEITMRILTALQIQLTEGEQARVWASRYDNIDLFMKHMEVRSLWRKRTKESIARMGEIGKEAIAMAPENPMGYISLAWNRWWFGMKGVSSQDNFKKAFELAQKARSLDESNPYPYGILSNIYFVMRQFDKAIASGERAVELDPNGAELHGLLGSTLCYAGKLDDGIDHLHQGIRLNPFPDSWYYFHLGRCYRQKGQYEEALTEFKKALQIHPDGMNNHIALAAVYVFLDRQEEAEAAAKKVMELNPKFSIARASKIWPYKNPADLRGLVDALRKAGLPEHPPLPLPDKPSIAVLAFDNLSGDPEQEYFSDGLSEEIINALSKSEDLFVIARNSSFTYKGKPVNVKQVSRELGVRYVLEGSVRKSEDHVRIIAQLIDATTGHHLWSERYDRDLKDNFAVQDEITMKIITALQVKLTEGEQARMWAKRFKRLDVTLKNMELMSLWRKFTEESFNRIPQVAQEVVDMAPELAIGYLHLSLYHYYLAKGGVSPRESIKKSFNFAQKALSLDESDSDAHGVLGQVYERMRQHEKAIAAGKRAIELNPNSALAHHWLGWTLIYAGRPDEAIEYFNKAIRLDPFPPHYFHEGMGFAYLIKGNYEKAITELKKALQLAPMNGGAHFKLAVAYGLLGREEEARASAEKTLELAPIVSVSMYAKTAPFKNQTDLELFLNGMRKAGFPEGG
jgi:TolB-like protein/Tfp pilus assembly protein PilF